MADGNTAEYSLKVTPVGRLIAEHPGLACVLEEYGIDYCCGGKRTLQAACIEKGVSVQEVVAKLLAAKQARKEPPAEPDWTKTSLTQLIEHIVESYHQPLREELPRLEELAEKVAHAHGDRHSEMVELLQILKAFREQLELHMQKEELVLFPGISAMEAGGSSASFACGVSIEYPIAFMTQEHDDAAEAISAMRALTKDYAPPADACNSFKVLLHSLAQLESAMHQHVHKENNILFPRALSLANIAPTPA